MIKILYAFVTTESDEPQAIQIFKDSFETASGISFDSIGEITVIENISSDNITESFLQSYIDTGHIMILRNTAVTTAQLTALKNCDILGVVPAGSNYYRNDQSFFTKNNNYVIFCGSGLRGVGNSTAYPCTFYDIAEAENIANVILDMRQYGATYNVTQIQRRSANVLAFKLQGITDVTSIGLSNHQSPIVFSNLSGSDISPLPSGVQTVKNTTANGMFFIDYVTTAGTINTGFTDGSMQAISGGTMQFADGQPNPTSKIFIRLTSGTYASNSVGVVLQNVTGFANNPNGNFAIVDRLNTSSWADMITITHTLGSGTFTGGNFYSASESYAVPEIAGKLLAIKILKNESWQKVISRAIQTASNTDYDLYDGFGNINVNEALQVFDTRTLTAPVLSLVLNTSPTFDIEWSIVPNAEKYELYFRGELVETLPAHLTKYRIVLTQRYSRNKKNYVKIRAINGDDYKDSNLLEISYYGYSKILVA